MIKLRDKIAPDPDVGCTGGCALSCAGLFVFLSLFLLVTPIIARVPAFPAVGPASVITFVVANLLSWIALASKHPSIRRAGLRAIQILWLMLGLTLLVGYIHDRFFL